MKVKVVKGNWWYTGLEGKVFEVIQTVSACPFRVTSGERKNCGLYEDDVEIIKENVQMFDMKSSPWYISVSSKAEFDAAQVWLKDNFGATLRATYYEGMTYLTNMTSGGKVYDDFVMHGNCDPKEDTRQKEIKLTFKTVIVSVEYPETITPEQEKLSSILKQIKALQNEAQSLQQMMGE